MLNSTIPNDEFRPGRFAVYRSAHFNTPWSWAEIGTVKPVTFLPPPTDGRTVRIDKRNVLRIEDTQAAAERCTAALNAAARASRAESEAAMNIYRAAVDRVRAEGVPEGVTIVEPDPMKAVVDIIGQCDASGLAEIALAVIERMGALGDDAHAALVGCLVHRDTDPAAILPGVKQMLAASFDALQALEPQDNEPDVDALIAEGEARADAVYDRDPDGYQAGQIGSTGSPELDALALRMERGEG